MKTQKNRRSLLLLALVPVLLACLWLADSGQAATSTWHTVTSKHGAGAFTVKSFGRTVNHPGALRLSARSSNGTSVSWTIACSRGFAVTAHGGTWNAGPGKHVKRLPIMRRADTCDVVAAFGTRGIDGGSFTVKLERKVGGILRAA